MYDVATVCGKEVVKLIEECWDIDRKKRPSSSEIKVQGPLRSSLHAAAENGRKPVFILTVQRGPDVQRDSQ
jgi:hypothetical protein